jgi:hypothetical protein
MFSINTSPLPTHKTFGHYAEFLFQRWIVRSRQQFTADEIHLIFDHPNIMVSAIKTLREIGGIQLYRNQLYIHVYPPIQLWHQIIEIVLQSDNKRDFL